ncbi:hypothetical protein DFH09DRAFT_1194068 [Mycena vulgaris]|nr:hypothetical protein DFH09DRAFT_1194068 [Mycena vulgaris]
MFIFGTFDSPTGVLPLGAPTRLGDISLHSFPSKTTVFPPMPTYSRTSSRSFPSAVTPTPTHSRSSSRPSHSLSPPIATHCDITPRASPSTAVFHAVLKFIENEMSTVNPGPNATKVFTIPRLGKGWYTLETQAAGNKTLAGVAFGRNSFCHALQDPLAKVCQGYTAGHLKVRTENTSFVCLYR